MSSSEGVVNLTYEELLALVSRYLRHPTRMVEGQIVRALDPLVKKIVRAEIARAKVGIDMFDDLAQAGRIGLLKALRHTDLCRINTFIPFVRRYVWGSVRRELTREIRAGGSSSLVIDMEAAPEFDTTGQADFLRVALEELPYRQRLLLYLRFWNGLTIRAAGEKVGLSPTQANRINSKALAKLREILGTYRPRV